MNKVVAFPSLKTRARNLEVEQNFVEHFSQVYQQTFRTVGDYDRSCWGVKELPTMVFIGGPIPVLDLENGITVYTLADRANRYEDIEVDVTAKQLCCDLAKMSLTKEGVARDTLRYLKGITKRLLINDNRLASYLLTDDQAIIWLDRKETLEGLTYRHVTRIELWREIEDTRL